MFLLIAVGYALFRSGRIDASGSRTLGTLLIWIVIPSVVIGSFCRERTDVSLSLFMQGSAASLLMLLLAMLISHIIFHRDAIDDFSAAFSNAGFIGIPLVQAVVGADMVFCIAPFVALLNMLQMTYGVRLMRGSGGRDGFAKALLNPVVASTLIDMMIFLCGLGPSVPQAAERTISYIGGMNAPLAMLVIGFYLAQSRLLDIFLEPRLYIVSAARLLLIPLISLLILSFLPLDDMVRLSVLIAASAPVGSNVAVYAEMCGLDHGYAGRVVALSTIISIITLPFVISIGVG